MCRKNLIFAVALTGFGAGLLTGCWIGSAAAQILWGAAAVGGGIYLLRCR